MYEAKDKVFMNTFFVTLSLVHRETPLASSWYSGMVVFVQHFWCYQCGIIQRDISCTDSIKKNCNYSKC